ncbi:MAG TPA: ABC transporter ATP-binding protein, partial [Woeseiaceae bacterium]|nr:ABC transporter ATP-binding protein [Woeseiaceae bacterium]
MSLLEVSGLNISYDGQSVVDNLSFSLDAGESLGLIGESGAGKTQTALAIMGLLPDHAKISGSVRFGDQEMVGANERQLDKLRAQRISIIFQDPLQALNPYVRIGKQLRRILTTHGLASQQQADARVIAMLEAVGLPDPARQAHSFSHQLSGGMRQRVMIAAALIAEPELLIADEPTTALDVTVQAQILELLAALRRDTALLLITHDLGIVAGHCERMLVLEGGRTVESGATRDLFARPRSGHTRSLLAAVPRLDAAEIPAPVAGPDMLSIKGLCVSHRESRNRRLRAVNGVEIAAKSGETLAIVGESGSGKSSLVRSILGLLPADSGTIVLDGSTLNPDVAKRAQSLRRDLQLVFQDPIGSLNPQMSVLEIVAEPLRVHAPSDTSRQREARVSNMLGELGLGEELLGRYPHELSGGQAQRVAIARALI